MNTNMPQGSFLGPPLFLIFINDIISNLFSKTTLFVDDTIISKHVTNTISTRNELQSDIKIIRDWTDKWKVNFILLIQKPFLYQGYLIGLNNCLRFKIIQSTMFNKIIKGLIKNTNTNGTWKNHLPVTMVINKAVKCFDMLK